MTDTDRHFFGFMLGCIIVLTAISVAHVVVHGF